MGPWDVGTQGCVDVGTLEHGGVGCEDIRTQRCARTGGCDKQTTPEFCDEFEKYNLWWSSVK